MAPFNPPDWAAQPCRMASMEIIGEDGSRDSQAIDLQAFYTLGRDSTSCDIVLDHASCSRCHAAIIHHQDGRLFVIDLSSAHGTRVNGAALPPNKPTVLKEGSELRFGADPRRFVVHCESSAEKRPGDSCDGSSLQRKRSAHQTYRASHLLVKHRDSRRPSSWKEPVVTRSKEEALAMVQAFRERISRGEVAFATLAETESHCSSARNGGDLGEFGPGQMQAAFEDAVSALAVGQLSGPVFSDSGVHIILRTG